MYTKLSRFFEWWLPLWSQPAIKIINHTWYIENRNTN